MTRVMLFHVAISGALLGVVTYLFVQSTAIDPEEHVRVLEAIDALSQSETNLRRNLLLVRGDLLLHYDSVNAALSDLQKRIDSLRLIVSASPEVNADELSDRFAALEANVSQDEELVEHFKWNNALLRNSWTYFAQKSSNVGELHLTGMRSGGALSGVVDRLLPAMMMLQHQPQSEAASRAAADLASLEALQPPPALKPHVDSMIKHGRLILQLAPQLDATLKALLTSQTPSLVNDLRVSYLKGHQHLAYRADRHRILLYAASLLLLVYLAYLFIRLQAGARALALSNAGLLKEIAERRQAEEKAHELQMELTHAHRLSLMGEMASGLAHELNQPLTAIRLYAKGCLRRLKAGETNTAEILEAMNQLSAQVLRAGQILGWIRGFVRKREGQATEVDVNAVIREAVGLLDYERHRQDIAVVLDLAAALPRITADKIEIQQTILNLARNSMEAMKDSGGGSGRLTVSTAGVQDGRIAIAVEDNGPGMAPEVLRRAFDAFFTTKPQGMGLGLAISRSMVEAHGGQLWATSQEGVGTTVHFTLPVAREESNDSSGRDSVIVELDGGRDGAAGDIPGDGKPAGRRARRHGLHRR